MASTEDSHAEQTINEEVLDRSSTEDGSFPFICPPEAPVFEPTQEEFLDPMRYINKIRPIAEKAGICKIKPPTDWQPPFSIDVDRFKFTPRIQKLNELEAKTRIKLNFFDQIAKFWELQGSLLKIPVVEGRALDLYSLYKSVQEEGGIETVIKDKKWARVASLMSFPNGRGLGSILKNHYERILYPYDVFQRGKSHLSQHGRDVKKKEDKDYKPSGSILKDGCSVDAKRRLSTDSSISSIDSSDSKDIEISPLDNKELKRLQFYGAGPKMAGYNKKKQEIDAKGSNKTRGKKVVYDFDPLAKYVCRTCDRGDMEESMLLCDGCDDSYHMFCLLPPLSEVPKGDWRCPKCVAEEVSKPTEAFGFEQAQREYSLQQFGEMADIFKLEYFSMPAHQVPTSLVEKEFWRIVSSLDEDVVVEYGADLHTMDHGSGFPTNQMFRNGEEHPLYKKYADSDWNLNNLPALRGSILGHISADISGMKVPWMYVGMCFSTFCWHNEDHWSYSINYLHWGEPKTWYGVPGSSAEKFEEAMKSAAPELFHSQPDLLHQLVTIMNPNVLMDAGVPVCRTDQHAGEFVITFPRAYHAGFNQGYNFAEAVNFAPADWLKVGRECVSHYSNLHRFCVFSHDELVCSMASNPDSLESRIASATYQDMQQMVDTENKMRKSLLEWGVTDAEKEEFELLPDDERQCEVCKTTCFLSAVTCSCTKQLVCLRHYSSLCNCLPDKHMLRYRYTLDELHIMLLKLKAKTDSFESWMLNVKNALESTTSKIDFEDLKELLMEGKEKNFPHSEILQTLEAVVENAEKCIVIAQHLNFNQIVAKASKTRSPKGKLTVEELISFANHLDSLPYKLKEETSIKELVSNVNDFQKEANELLTEEIVDCEKIEKCIKVGFSLNIELTELDKLCPKLEKMKYLQNIKKLKENPDQVTIEFLQMLLNSGNPQDVLCDLNIEIPDIGKLMKTIQDWEENAKSCLSSKLRQGLPEVEELLNEAEDIPAFLPSKTALEELFKKATDWKMSVETIVEAEFYPYLDIVEDLVSKGLSIPLDLQYLPALQSQINAVKMWKERAARIFLRKNSPFSLMEVISPRENVGIHTYRVKKRTLRDNPEYIPNNSVFGVKLTGNVSPDEVTKAFRAAERNELQITCHLRISNIQKKCNATSDTKYCICKQVASGSMTECTLCRNWFHNSCIGSLRIMKNKKIDPTGTKFLCPVCLRTRRPHLETVLSLLVSLQKIPVRFPEGEALQCLGIRILNWLERSRELLNTEEMNDAYERVLQEEHNESNDKTNLESGSNKIISQSTINLPQSTVNSPQTTVNSSLSTGDSTQSTVNFPQSNISLSQNTVNSSPTKDSEVCVKRPFRDPPEEPLVILSQKSRLVLKQLMTEGDLMEVTLDESEQMWRILQATKPASQRETKFSPPAKKKKKLEIREENEDDCAAPRCLHPALGRDIVDWVQCDGGCDQWFHMHCVGIHKTDISEDEDFICQQCSVSNEGSSDVMDEEEIDFSLVKIEQNLGSNDVPVDPLMVEQDPLLIENDTVPSEQCYSNEECVILEDG